MLYQKIIRPLLFRFTDPETIHHAVIKGLGLISQVPLINSAIKQRCLVNDPRLQVQIGKLRLKNPIGLSAGFDKNVEAPLAYPMLGFGWAELGSITYSGQPGNPRPRLWRLPKDQGLIVYYGLSNNGACKVTNELKKLGQKPNPISLGLSIAPTTGLKLEQMTDDYIKSILAIHAYADYITLNVSCPNVAACDIFSQISFIENLAASVRAAMTRHNISKDLFLKIGPGHSDADLDRIINACLKNNFTGIIATNLIKNRRLATFQSSPNELNHPGGISGRCLQDLSNRAISYLYKQSQGRLKIIGVGGIFTADDAYRKIKLGASAVQLITGFIYGGPLVIRQINLGLLKLLDQDGLKTLSQAVGRDIN